MIFLLGVLASANRELREGGLWDVVSPFASEDDGALGDHDASELRVPLALVGHA